MKTYKCPQMLDLIGSSQMFSGTCYVTNPMINVFFLVSLFMCFVFFFAITLTHWLLWKLAIAGLHLNTELQDINLQLRTKKPELQVYINSQMWIIKSELWDKLLILKKKKSELWTCNHWEKLRIVAETSLHRLFINMTDKRKSHVTETDC